MVCLARTPAKLDAAPWRREVDVFASSVGGNLAEAMRDVDVAVYLVHSIGQGENWAEREVADATNFARFASEAGVKRIVFLGGLGDDDDSLSVHLRSRHEVGIALASFGTEVVELRAGVIIGSGSASFEMLRYLVDVLPVMVTPKWVSTKCQPIAIADVIKVLVAAITTSEAVGGVFELGGPDVVSYAEMMALYAEVAGLPRRRLIPVPFLTPRLSSHWVGLVTPVPAVLARELVESLINEVTVKNRDAAEAFGVEPMSLRMGFTRALAAIESGAVPTRHTNADLNVFAPTATDPAWSGGTVLRDVQSMSSAASPEQVFSSVEAVGGERGWYSGEFLWRVRGWLDQIAGGPGLRRGRPARLAVGEPVDFWRVTDLEPGRRLRLRAEMVLPGEAWLTWDLEPEGSGTRIVQTAEYRPRGLLGRAYWYSVAPFHRFVFPGMLRGILKNAEIPKGTL